MKENFSIDHRIILPDGSEKTVHEEAKVLFDETGQATRMIGMVQDITKRKQAEDELKKSREQLHKLTMHLQNVREDERKRIARDIHDELGQILSVFNLELLWIKKRLHIDQKSLTNKIREIMKMADGAIDSVQRISSELRPTLLDDLGLVAGIEWHAQDFERRTGIKCNLAMGPEEISLDDKLSTALFRIFQESLTNVLRHAEATSLDVSMSITGGQLVLEIKDNGRGISDKDVSGSKSLGLIGMRERVSPWSGEINVTGVTGEGTTVSVSVPLDKKGED
jgi:signal transduction histidine kinase